MASNQEFDDEQDQLIFGENGNGLIEGEKYDEEMWRGILRDEEFEAQVDDDVFDEQASAGVNNNSDFGLTPQEEVAATTLSPAPPVVKEDDGMAAFLGLDDGPIKPGETESAYLARLSQAEETMRLRHRRMRLPPDHLPPFRSLPLGVQVKEMEIVANGWELHNEKMSKDSKQYDLKYKQEFDERYERLKKLNQSLRAKALKEHRELDEKVRNPRVSTPPPPGEPSRQLWDWGFDGPLRLVYNPRVELDFLRQELKTEQENIARLSASESRPETSSNGPRRTAYVNNAAPDFSVQPRARREGARYHRSVAVSDDEDVDDELDDDDYVEDEDEEEVQPVRKQSRYVTDNPARSTPRSEYNFCSSPQEISQVQNLARTRAHQRELSRAAQQGRAPPRPIYQPPQPKAQKRKRREYSPPPEERPAKRALPMARKCMACWRRKGDLKVLPCDLRESAPNPCTRCVELGYLCVENLNYRERHKRKANAGGPDLDPDLAKEAFKRGPSKPPVAKKPQNNAVMPPKIPARRGRPPGSKNQTPRGRSPVPQEQPIYHPQPEALAVQYEPAAGYPANGLGGYIAPQNIFQQNDGHPYYQNNNPYDPQAIDQPHFRPELDQVDVSWAGYAGHPIHSINDNLMYPPLPAAAGDAFNNKQVGLPDLMQHLDDAFQHQQVDAAVNYESIDELNRNRQESTVSATGQRAALNSALEDFNIHENTDVDDLKLLNA